MMSTNNSPNPGDFARPVPAPPQGSYKGDDAGTTTSLDVLESLAGLPVAQHLAIYEDLHGQLSADLGSTSQEQW
ncbi:hypothetical protein GCM10009628_39010 [Paeniglutamicibacter kerguelensis]|uniref:Uncharacterized protein n=1 Tax=Paeniglutamicibacter kerguelensis TaxID=254788 RepID=A0ABS4XA03_9MICC|nr:hypothetical protein [Paeniglutamicibacter kerguelensis]